MSNKYTNYIKLYFLPYCNHNHLPKLFFNAVKYEILEIFNDILLLPSIKKSTKLKYNICLNTYNPENGINSLMNAIKNGNIIMVNKLLQLIDKNNQKMMHEILFNKDFDNKNLLHFICLNFNIDIAKMIMNLYPFQEQR